MAKFGGYPRLDGFIAKSELTTALETCRNAFVSIAVFSGMSNVLMLTGAVFMLEDTTASCRAAAFLLLLL